MPKETVISFIIPAYNSEKYLNKCLDSFLCEESLDWIEVIVVNDGSKDTTADIAAGYCKKYPETFRLINKENGGHGSAINVGSRAAVGKYMKVIDSDDWVITENLVEYIHFLQGTNADVILTPFHMIDMTTRERTVQKMYITDYSRKYTLAELVSEWKTFDRCTTFHGITYCTEFYDQYRHELPEKVFYEDQEYATIPFCYAKSVAVFNLFVYQYLVGNNEQSVAKSNQIKRIGHLEIVIEHMLAYWKNHLADETFSKEYFLQKLEDGVLAYYRIMCIVSENKREGRKQCGHLNKIVKRDCPEIYHRLYKKYSLFTVFSMLHIDEIAYEKMIHSKIFRFIRKNHKIERE